MMKYDAFISYRHTEPDMFVAKRIHKFLETYKVPINVRKKIGKKKIKRVFRDQEELPIGSDLGDNIESALKESGFLVVICSPRTKESEWVQKEIETFISLHGRERVLAVLVEGEPIDSFPKQLLVDDQGNNVEPLAADVRGMNQKQMNKKIKSEGIRLVASILGCDYDDLKQRHKERRIKKYFAVAAAVAVLAISFSIYASYNLARINENYQAKLINESKTLAATALDELETGDRITAAMIALEGLPENGERPLVSESIYALARSLNTYEIGTELIHDKLLEHELAVDNMFFTEDGTRLVSSDYGSNIYYWDIETGDKLFFAVPDYYDGKVEKIASLYCDDKAVYVASDKSLKALDFEGNELYKVVYDGISLGDPAFCNKQSTVLVNDSDYVYLYNLSDGSIIKKIAAEADYQFSSDKCISDDGKYAVVETGNPNGEGRCIQFINLETEEMKRATLSYDSILDLTFTADGYFAVVDMDLLKLAGYDPMDMEVKKFDYETGELIWDSTVKYLPNGVNMTWTDLKTRVYTDQAGEEHSELFVSGCTVVYGLDLTDGTPFLELNESANIEHFGIKLDACYGFVLRVDGTLDVCNFTDGTIYSDNAISISDGMTMDFALKSGVLAVRGYLSNKIVIMSYQTGEGMETIAEFDNDIDDTICSPNETTYLVSVQMDNYLDYHYSYKIYDADTDELLDTVEVADEKVYKAPVYLDDNKIAIFPASNTFKVYDIAKKKIKEYKIYDQESPVSDCVVNGDALLVTKSNDLYLYNTKKMKVKAFEEMEQYVYKADVTSDGSYIFFTDYNCNLFKLDTKTAVCEQIAEDYLIKCYSISADNTRIALACTDGKLRFYDIETGAITEVMDFYVTSSNTVMKFTDDGKYLLIHGGDYYFKVYDLDTNEIVFITDAQINTVTYTSYDPDNGILAIKNQNSMYLIDSINWGVLQYAPYAKVYMPKHQSILSTRYTNLYKFKYMTYEDLLEQAKILTKNEKLSKIQKLKYNIQ